MRRDISRRIERLEQVAGITAKPLPIIVFYFCDGGNHAKTTDANGIESQKKNQQILNCASLLIPRWRIVGGAS